MGGSGQQTGGFSGKDFMPVAGDKSVGHIAQRTGKNAEENQTAPRPAQVAGDLQSGVGAGEDFPFEQHHHTRGRGGNGRDLFAQQADGEGGLQRRKGKQRGAFVAQNELHRTLAEGAFAIVEDNGGRVAHGRFLRETRGRLAARRLRRMRELRPLFFTSARRSRGRSSSVPSSKPQMLRKKAWL